MRFSINVTSEPNYKPVTLEDCKKSLEILATETRHDSKISDYIDMAISQAENFTGQYFAQRTATVYLDKFIEYIRLPVHPLTAVESITYYDGDNTLQTLATTDYEVDLYASPPLIRITEFPSTKARLSAVQINLTVGYPSNNSPVNADKIPSAIKKAITFKVYQDFLNRGDEDEQINRAFEALLYNYRFTKV